MSRFTIKVVSLQLSEVTDNVTGKVYKCKNEPYTRERNGKQFKQFYVNVSNVETKNMKDKFSFPWKAIKQEDGKFHAKNPIGMVHETDLSGRTSTISEEIFCFE